MSAMAERRAPAAPRCKITNQEKERRSVDYGFENRRETGRSVFGASSKA